MLHSHARAHTQTGNNNNKSRLSPITHSQHIHSSKSTVSQSDLVPKLLACWLFLLLPVFFLLLSAQQSNGQSLITSIITHLLVVSVYCCGQIMQMCANVARTYRCVRCAFINIEKDLQVMTAVISAIPPT